MPPLIEIWIKAVLGAGVFAGILCGGLWVTSVFLQKRRNQIDEINLTSKKIRIDIDNKPIDDLLADSNRSHGTDDLVKKPGAGDK